jgi:hypothetical protein
MPDIHEDEPEARCTARAGKPRSTTERACFTTCLEAMPTSAAREVTLYLALTFPPSSPRPLAGPMTDQSLIRFGSVTVQSGGPPLGPKPSPSLASPRSTDEQRWARGRSSFGPAPCVMVIVPEAFRYGGSAGIGLAHGQHRSRRAADAFPQLDGSRRRARERGLAGPAPSVGKLRGSSPAAGRPCVASRLPARSEVRRRLRHFDTRSCILPQSTWPSISQSGSVGHFLGP